MQDGTQDQNQERIDAAEHAQIANETLENAQAENNQDILPDDPDEVTTIKTEFDKKEKDYQTKLKTLEDEKNNFDKRLRDTQHKLHMLTAEKTNQPADKKDEGNQTGQTFDEYITGLKDDFENDPSGAITKMASDFAADRETMRKQYRDELSQLRDSIMNEVMMENPENAQLMAAVEELNVARPDLANLNQKQKIEFVKMMRGATDKGNGNGDGNRMMRSASNDDATDRSLLTGTRRLANKGNGLPAWLNDPAVQREAAGKFESKREIVDWLDPSKAMKMAKELVAKKTD